MFKTVRLYLSEIKFAHTVFAMPFAMAGAALAFSEAAAARDGRPAPLFVAEKLALIIAATVGARSAAMMFNRLADVRYDAANPRTARRAVVTGAISKPAAWGFVGCMCAVFIIAAALLNTLSLALSPLALVVVLGYSLTKRFTPLTHFFLGLALALAPMGAWIGVLGSLASFEIPALMAGAVLLWTAGFDIIYACRDYRVDAASALHSIPKSIGIEKALYLSAVLHAAAVLLLISLLAVSPSLGLIFAFGVVAIAALLFFEHMIVRPNDLSRINTAFFTINGIVSAVLLVCVILDVLLPC